MTGNEKISVKIVALVIAVKVTLSFLIIPKYGAVGAACLTAFCLALLQLLLAYYANKHIGATGGIWRLFTK